MPTRAITSLRDAAIAAHLATYERAIADIASGREKVSEALYHEIGAAASAVDRRRLIRLRRDAFNGRIDSAALRATTDLVSPATAALLEDLSRQHATIEASTDAVLRLHDTAIQRARRQLKTLLHDGAFRKGLVLSSIALHRRVNGYLSAPGELPGKYEQVERGLLKYLTRTAMKATPFATFCRILPGRFSRTDDPSALVGDPSVVTTATRLNKAILGLLWPDLATSEHVRKRLRLSLNATVSERSGQLTYLARVGERESVRSLRITDAVAAVCDLVKDGALTFDETVRALSRHARVSATEGEAALFVEELVKVGILQRECAIPDQDLNWSHKLQAFLREEPNGPHSGLADALAELDALASEFDADVGEHTEGLVARMLDVVDHISPTVNGNRTPLRGPPVYVDTTSSATLVQRHGDDAAKLLATVAAMVDATQVFTQPFVMQQSMRAFFDATYGRDRTVPLVEFFEAFHKELLTPHYASRRNRPGGVSLGSQGRFWNPMKIEGLDAAAGARSAIVTAIAALWRTDPAQRELHLPLRYIEDVVSGLPRPAPETSVCLFGQVFQQDGVQRMMWPGAVHYTGYGKFYSRFLHSLPSQFHTDLRAHNQRLATTMYAEIGGDGDFNGNLHPPLVDYEIQYPGASLRADTRALRVADLSVGTSSEAPVLRLKHIPTGKPVVPVDAGFLTPRRRPALYQMLTWFTQSSMGALPLPEALGESDPGNEECIYRPRIVCDGVIVARRRWSISELAFPKPHKAEAPSTYFVRVNAWRCARGIPSEVFVRVTTRSGVATLSEAETTEEDMAGDESFDESEPSIQTVSARSSRDFYKPQYIDFTSPILVRLFARIPGNLERFLMHFEERYPAEEQLLEWKGDRYSTEQVIQLSRYSTRHLQGQL